MAAHRPSSPRARVLGWAAQRAPPIVFLAAALAGLYLLAGSLAGSSSRVARRLQLEAAAAATAADERIPRILHHGASKCVPLAPAH